ncbi:MAG: hypothetical protein ISR85_05920 [Kiritimatiellales bacterium]|nr:hypothetical protein [Kiritimatiellales bacterium]
MGKKILGLDLGTNSIGWGVVEESGGGQFKLLGKGVHIFPEGTNRDSKGSESSKASDRTQHRSARRLKYRRKLRKIETLKVLSEAKLCPPLKANELNAWRYDRTYPANAAFRDWCKTSDPKNGDGEFSNPYYFRWLASTKKLDRDSETESHELGRALYHLAQRRGFKSNRLDASSDDAKGELRERMLELLESEYSGQDELCNAIEALVEGIEDKAVLRFHKSTLKAVRKQSGLEAAQVFLREHLNKRENLGKVKGGIVDLTREMEAKGYATLGQLFWMEYYRCGKRIRNHYTSREEHYEDEFKKICEMQGIAVGGELWGKLYDAIFFQRPLKSQKGLVANCPFEPKKKRAPISHPLFEEFRMWQTLNNIKIQPWGDDELRPLTTEEKAAVIPKFHRAKVSFDFSDIAGIKKLTPTGQDYGYLGDKDFSAHVKFNYRSDQSIAGCPLTAALMRLFDKDDYVKAIFDLYQGKKVDKNGHQKTADDVLNEVWHVLFSFNKQQKLKEYAVEKLGLDEKGATAFSKIKPKQGYGALSLTAIRRILPYLRQGHIYSHAVFFANLPAVVGGGVHDFPELEQEITEIIDSHGRYQKGVKLANHFQEFRKKKPEDIEYWISKGWNQWCDELGKAAKKLFGIEQWNELTESGQEALCLETRDILNALPDNGGFVEPLTVEKRIKTLLLEWADAQGKREEVEMRLDRLYHPSKEEPYEAVEKDGFTLLGNPEISSIRNPVFNRAMHRLKAMVNELIRTKKIDAKTVIHLEVAREMNDANRRAALRTWNEKRRKLKEHYKKSVEEVLRSIGTDREASENEILKYQLAMEQNANTLVRIEATDSAMLKYQLWEEQKHICPYTGKTISLSDFIGKNPKFDIEHTIPRSLSCDNSQENKTLCELNYNRNVKKSSIPYNCPEYEKILQRVDHWRVRVKELDHLIEQKKKAGKHAADKDTKDKIIQARLVLQYERNYLWGKYRRFTMKDAPEGFKNSQLVDTRIITKYARSYLKSVFPVVHTVNGKITDDFRHYWGLQAEGEAKDRGNHVHHAIDAIVAACITRRQYQQLAEAYGNSERGREKFHVKEPWNHFVEDIKKLKNQILVSHYAPNHLLKQTKKKVKVRGKLVVQQGQTARGSLHNDAFYGKIEHHGQHKYVIRVPLVPNQIGGNKGFKPEAYKDSDLKDIFEARFLNKPSGNELAEQEYAKRKEWRTRNLERIVDPIIRDIVITTVHARMEAGLSFKDALKEAFWMNEGKGIPIRKARCAVNAVKNPIPLKLQSHMSEKSRRPYKEYYYVNNEENYSIAVYEGQNKKGAVVRNCRVFSNYLATNPEEEVDGIKYSERFEAFNKGDVILAFKYELKVGIPVLFPGGMSLFDLEDMSQSQLRSRLYYMYGIKGDDGRAKFRFHQEARIDKEQETPVAKLDIQSPASKLWISQSNLDILVGGVDFKLNSLGEIEFIKGKERC